MRGVEDQEGRDAIKKVLTTSNSLGELRSFKRSLKEIPPKLQLDSLARIKQNNKQLLRAFDSSLSSEAKSEDHELAAPTRQLVAEDPQQKFASEVVKASNKMKARRQRSKDEEEDDDNPIRTLR